MNISIYIKLLIAYHFKKVHISSDYRHLQFVIDKNYFDRLPDGKYHEVAGFPIASYSDYYSITTEGKTALFFNRSLWHTRIISWVAIVISIIALFK